MRKPTSFMKAFAWHRAAIAGERPATIEGEIQCGWFRTRFVRGGPWVPARIWLHREIDPATGELTDDERFLAEIDGERRDAQTVWDWVCGNPISKDQYEDLCRMKERTPAMAATHVALDLSQKAIRP